jgi:hypothetical protein
VASLPDKSLKLRACPQGKSLQEPSIYENHTQSEATPMDWCCCYMVMVNGDQISPAAEFPRPSW